MPVIRYPAVVLQDAAGLFTALPAVGRAAVLRSDGGRQAGAGEGAGADVLRPLRMRNAEWKTLPRGSGTKTGRLDALPLIPHSAFG